MCSLSFSNVYTFLLKLGAGPPLSMKFLPEMWVRGRVVVTPTTAAYGSNNTLIEVHLCREIQLSASHFSLISLDAMDIELYSMKGNRGVKVITGSNHMLVVLMIFFQENTLAVFNHSPSVWTKNNSFIFRYSKNFR